MNPVRSRFVRLWTLLFGLVVPSSGVAEEALEETPEVEFRARTLGSKFLGGRQCNPDAFGELGTLRESYGVHGVVGQSLALAMRGCDDAVGWAELFAARIRSEDTDEDRLKLAAAWIRAARWSEAHAVALPLAQAQGPSSRAAWLVGYALFQLEEREAAAPWLLGARETVDGKKRTDAPVMLALIQLDAGEPDAALAELDGAIERLPEAASLHAVRAQVLQRLGRADEAAQAAARNQALARAQERDDRRMARFRALDMAWNQAFRAKDDAASAAMMKRLVDEGPKDDVIELFEARLAAAQKAEKAQLASQLQAHLKTLRRR